MDNLIKIFIEGNIGSGKSTIAEKLSERLVSECKVFLEMVEKWKKCGLLQKMYKNPERWYLTFQHMALMCKYLQHLKMTNKHVNIIERSGISDRYAFMQKAIDEKLLEDCETFTYDLYYDALTKNMNIIPEGSIFIYIRTTPENCKQRVKQRNRDGEDEISLGYLEKIDKYHEINVLDIIMEKYEGTTNLLIVNNDGDIEKTLTIILDWLNRQHNIY